MRHGDPGAPGDGGRGGGRDEPHGERDRVLDDESGLSEVDGEALVNKSLELLLERERPTSIFRELRLSTISEYFPPHLGGLRRCRS